MSAAGFTWRLNATLAVIGGKWKPLILFQLSRGESRYGALKRAVEGVSDKMLIQQLKELQADGVVDRKDYQQVPPKVEYALTPFGRTLAKALGPLCTWGADNMDEIERLVARRATRKPD